jgi:hypothetical protein
VEILCRHAELPQLMLALCATSGFSSRLNRRQQERHQHADHGDHNQKLNQGESAAKSGRRAWH